MWIGWPGDVSTFTDDARAELDPAAVRRILRSIAGSGRSEDGHGLERGGRTPVV